jgi:hypothetical protein
MMVLIVAVSEVKDGVGDMAETDRIRARIAAAKLRSREIRLAPLRMGWNGPLPPDYARGASTPIRPMSDASVSFAEGELDCLIVSGDDPIRSEFASRKAERDRRMVAYPSGDTFLSAYTKVAREFVRQVGMREEEFRALSEMLFDNYRRTHTRLHPQERPPEGRWFQPVTELFRGVDCANPNVDFVGCMILMTDAAADVCAIPVRDRIQVLAANVATACADDIARIAEVASYRHLGLVIDRTVEESRVDFCAEFRAGR